MMAMHKKFHTIKNNYYKLCLIFSFEEINEQYLNNGHFQQHPDVSVNDY